MTTRSQDAQNLQAVNLESQPSTSLPSYDSDDEDVPVQAIPARSRSPNTHARQQSREPLLLPISVDSRSSRRGLGKASTPSNAFGAIKEIFQANLGFMLACGASICFCLINVFVAIFSTSEESIPTCELMFIRMFITGAGCYGYMKATGMEHPALGPPAVRTLLVVRGCVGFFGISSLYFALGYLSLSDSVCLTFLTPILTGIVAFFVLAEPYTFYEALAAIVSLLGVILIAKPSVLFDPADATPIQHEGRPVTERERLVAVCISLVGVCGATGAYLTIRKIGNRASALHSILYFSYATCIISVILSILLPSQRPILPHSNLILVLIAIGFLGFGAQVLLTMSLQKEKAGRATIASYIQMPMALFFERLVFHRSPDVLSLIGSAVIVGSALGVVVQKSFKAKPKVVDEGDDVVFAIDDDGQERK